MHVAYIGNFRAPHSTENHVARAMRADGHTVSMLQEDDTVSWSWIARPTMPVDVLLWTHTGGFPPGDEIWQHENLKSFRIWSGAPIVGVHLDRWWGLPRETQITVDRKAFFHTPDVLYTADGGHDQRWADQGIVHRWFPPGISAPECEPGIRSGLLESDVAFVGSWQGGYHPEWPHRRQLVDWLQASPFNVTFWPPPGQPAIRGTKLRALYASTKVVVGDSCLVPYPNGDPVCRYFSDRIPETIGRGGYLIHPRVAGVTDGTLYTEGEHLGCWGLGDWDELGYQIETALQHPDQRAAVTAAGRAHVLADHTYEVRMRRLLAEVTA